MEDNNLEQIKELVNNYDHVLHTTLYEDDEYRLMLFDIVERLKKLLN